MRALLALIVVGGLAALAWSYSSDSGPGDGSASPSTLTEAAAEPEIDLYRPIRGEEYPNGKRVAARLAQQALTYDEEDTPRSVARKLGDSAAGLGATTRVLEEVVEPGSRSSAEVIYPQLSGLTATSLGAMVVVRQEVESEDGEESSTTRVVDVRLRRSGGPWSLDQIASFGGPATPEPASLSPSAQRVLDNPGIDLPDSGRWDIFRGGVDDALLDALDEASRNRKLSVTVIDSGHPPNVWGTTRPSAHSAGFAVDIWAVDGVPVIKQRQTGSPAYDLAAELAAGGAVQLGSPWALGAGGFTDEVHQDHIHLQQSSTLG